MNLLSAVSNLSESICSTTYPYKKMIENIEYTLYVSKTINSLKFSLFPERQ